MLIYKMCIKGRVQFLLQAQQEAPLGTLCTGSCLHSLDINSSTENTRLYYTDTMHTINNTTGRYICILFIPRHQWLLEWHWLDIMWCENFALFSNQSWSKGLCYVGFYRGHIEKDMTQRYVILHFISPLFAISPLCEATLSLFTSTELQK